jgi:hypothetical protein
MSGGVTIFTVNSQTKTRRMNYKVIRIIGVVMLVLGATAIILTIMEGKKSVIGSIAAGGIPIMVGGLLLGRSLRMENKSKATGDPSDTPK